MRKIEIDLTVPQYWAHKENGLTDDEIAELNFVSLIVVIRWKKENDVKGGLNTIQRRFTDEELEILKNCPVGYAMARVRILQQGWDFERAITEPRIEKKRFTAEEVRKMKLSQVGYQMAYDRIKRGWSFEEAISAPVGTDKRKRGA